MTDFEWPTDVDGSNVRMPVVYQLDTKREDFDSSPREDLLQFLYAHGVPYATFIVGNTITIRQHPDGLYLHTWHAITSEPTEQGKTPKLVMCPTCPPPCVQQRLHVTRLVSAPPHTGRGFCHADAFAEFQPAT